jgi:hypothetical protein
MLIICSSSLQPILTNKQKKKNCCSETLQPHNKLNPMTILDNTAVSREARR